MSERSSVQNPMLKYAQQIGWQYVRPPESLRLRGDETGLPKTLKNLCEQVKRDSIPFGHFFRSGYLPGRPCSHVAESDEPIFDFF